jgi:Tol biopolymer transport system component
VGRGGLQAVALIAGTAALATPATAMGAYPGPNGRIFFENDGAIFSIRPDGGDRQRLVDAGREPAVSADGMTIVFQRAGNLYTANRSGGDVRQVTDTPKAERTPSFSPSGNKLLYATDKTIDDPAQIYTVRVDGTERTRLTQNELSSFEPEYSPNGNKIAFTRQGRPPDPAGVFVMGADGSNAQEPRDDFAARSPSWSGDGNQIACEGIESGAIWVIRPSLINESLERITGKNRFGDRDPAAAPSGSKIVFSGERNDRRGLFVIGGGSIEALTTVPAERGTAGVNPYWAPAP